MRASISCSTRFVRPSRRGRKRSIRDASFYLARRIAMSDTSTALRLGVGHDRLAEASDVRSIGWIGAGLLATLVVIVLLLPFDMANGPQYVPTVFGP
jgi:hypothetical protein